MRQKLALIISLSAVMFILPIGCERPFEKQAAKNFLKGMPTTKDIVRLLIQNHDIPLSIHSSCAGVGTELSDATLGDYISGFLGELKSGGNSIESTCRRESAENGKTFNWACSIVIHHALKDDEWGWGVDFSVQELEGTIVPQSIRCTGSG